MCQVMYCMEKSYYDLDDKVCEIFNQVCKMYNQSSSSVVKICVYEMIVDLVWMLVMVMCKSIVVGVWVNFDLLNVEQVLYSVMNELFKVKYDYFMVWVCLCFYVGVLDEVDLELVVVNFVFGEMLVCCCDCVMMDCLVLLYILLKIDMEENWSVFN